MSDTESSLPSAPECERRCQEFASVTGTDTALAMFYLQDRDWSLDRALNSYFEEAGMAEPSSGPSQNQSDNNSTAQSQASAAMDSEPHRIRLMSWNIDGLDKKNLRSRTLGVCDAIKKEDPDVVFLQEVVAESEELLQDNCPMYHMIPGRDVEYYTAMLLKIGRVQTEATKIIAYPGTVMGRNILAVKCTVKGEKFYLMTSHLESTKNYAAERKSQLKMAFSHLKGVTADITVVFGGDLNLRDEEVVEVGIPEQVYDIWEVTGKRPHAKFTWDMQRNDNLEFPRFKPKCRFDRLYIRHSSPKVVTPEYFELCGLERLKSCQRFCSDHWALLTHLNILSKLFEDKTIRAEIAEGKRDEPPAVRPRLKLLPRTVKDPTNDCVNTQRNASIFGTGKPRDKVDAEEADSSNRSRTTSEDSQMR